MKKPGRDDANYSGLSQGTQREYECQCLEKFSTERIEAVTCLGVTNDAVKIGMQAVKVIRARQERIVYVESVNVKRELFDRLKRKRFFPAVRI